MVNFYYLFSQSEGHIDLPIIVFQVYKYQVTGINTSKNHKTHVW